MSNFDIAIGGGVGMATVPEFRAWPKIVQNFDVRFVQLPDDLLVKLSKDTGQEIGLIPFALYPGINYPIRTVVGTGTVIYCRADAPDDFAYDVAKAIDEQQDQLQWSNQDFSYNIHNVWKAEDVPLHPGAERYYKEKGYIK